MCVGLAAKVVGVRHGMAVVDASGAKREVSAELLDDLEPGDYVMVHAGLAIAKITDDDTDETDRIMGALGCPPQESMALEALDSCPQEPRVGI